jgi:hypothetical protein
VTEEIKNQNSAPLNSKKKRTLFHKVVNVFIYTGVGVIVGLMILFGISQTSMFREFLREKIITIANGELNGTLNIEKIEGTLFTSLILRNTSIKMGNDTLLNAGLIDVRVSPLKMLFKIIYIRKIAIENTTISFLKDSSGTLNISKLFQPSAEEDTTTTEFPFLIQLADLSCKNINFSLQSFDKKGSKEFYNNLNLDDFRIKNLNLNLKASADISGRIFSLNIDQLSFEPNINNFRLSKLSGNFGIARDLIVVDDFAFRTGNSVLNTNLDIKGFDLFSEDSAKNINDAYLNLKLDAQEFDFTDLTAFVPATGLLKGKLSVVADVGGSFNNLMIKQLEIKVGESILKTSGRLQDLSKTENLTISASFYECSINQSDVKNLLPDINIPYFPELGTLRFDTLRYEGQPLKFTSTFYLQTDRGNVDGNVFLDLTGKDMVYDISFNTRKLDISPFAGLSSVLNSSGSVKGSGTSIETLNSEIKFSASNSTLQGYSLGNLMLDVSAAEKNIDYTLNLDSDTSYAFIKGTLDFNSSDNPIYDFDGYGRRINLKNYLKGNSLSTNLNFNVSATGNDFDPERADLFVNLLLYNSTINNIKIDTTRTIVDISTIGEREKTINLISDIADVTVTGKFFISELTGLISAESEIISQAISEKINRISPDSLIEKNRLSTNFSVNRNSSFFNLPQNPVFIDFLVDLKDFRLVSLFLKDSKLDINGKISGSLKSDPDDFVMNVYTDLDYVRYWGSEQVFFLSSMKLDYELENSLGQADFNNLRSDLKLSLYRAFAGSYLNKIDFKLKLNESIATVDFSGYVNNDIFSRLIGQVDLTSDKAALNLDSLGIKFRDFAIYNLSPVEFNFKDKKLDVKNFLIGNENQKLQLAGFIDFESGQDLNISLKDFQVKEFFRDLLGMEEQESPQGKISLNASVIGTLNNPVINLSTSIDSLRYGNSKPVIINGKFDYANSLLYTNIKILNTFINKQFPEFTINGSIPLDLSFAGNSNNNQQPAQLDLTINSKNFDISFLGDGLPGVSDVRGILNGNLKLSGSLKEIEAEGKLDLFNAGLKGKNNNLEYNIGLSLDVKKDELIIDTFFVENNSSTPEGGRILFNGSIKHKNFKPQQIDVFAEGTIKVLSEESKYTSPAVYGDLVIGTKGKVELTSINNITSFNAPLLVKKADLTFPLTQSAYQNTAENFIYKYPVYGTKRTQTDIEFDELVNLSQRKSVRKQGSPVSKSSFEYAITIDVENEARMIVILSKELNQKLTAYLNGNFKYEYIGGRQFIRGELDLLDGSNLEFIKSFEALGTIKFGNDLTNPELNITAAYKDYFTPDTSSTGLEELVAVKIKLKGPLSELSKNFIRDPNNIAVYKGEYNIENDLPSVEYDVSDAIMFIITNQFTSTASQQDKNVAVSTATSLAGSILGGFLNKQLGDYVRNVQLRQVGTQTKFSLIGKAGSIRYEIGGSTDVFQDLSRANIKIEYPLIKKLLLRLERRESITESNITTQMINELGIKYRFEF